MRAIIVDDEAPARRRLRGVLQQINTVTRIDECASGRDAVELLKRGAPDLVFLDIQMPDLDGFAVAAAASPERPPAIVFVTAYDEHAVRAFEIQAFDYLLKPFDDERVIATVKRAEDFLEWIRRGGEQDRSDSGQPVMRGFGDVTVDFATHQVRRAGKTAELRPKEYALLVALLRRGGRVASRLELLREVWGYAEDVMSRTVDTHVAMLRRKLEHDPAHPRHIVTVRTFGYRIER
jgi:DNA-binding response OmpR family regulator